VTELRFDSLPPAARLQGALQRIRPGCSVRDVDTEGGRSVFLLLVPDDLAEFCDPLLTFLEHGGSIHRVLQLYARWIGSDAATMAGEAQEAWDEEPRVQPFDDPVYGDRRGRGEAQR